MSDSNRQWNKSIIFTLLGGGLEILTKHAKDEEQKQEIIEDIANHYKKIIEKGAKISGMPLIGMRCNGDLILFKEDTSNEDILHAIHKFGLFKKEHALSQNKRTAVYIPGEADSPEDVAQDSSLLVAHCSALNDFNGFFVDLKNIYQEIDDSTDFSKIAQLKNNQGPRNRFCPIVLVRTTMKTKCTTTNP